eukprot:TRINITY_DN1422_c3_g1_i1.p1 TRINITY_DN1422_c3_g1~~TRINITY_DN1422_c3_g1_i1.p1  ORF type:complete len:805 (+),score=183.86 TRINITY_DN1422_c3_g1_i1:76-2415(+)
MSSQGSPGRRRNAAGGYAAPTASSARRGSSPAAFAGLEGRGASTAVSSATSLSAGEARLAATSFLVAEPPAGLTNALREHQQKQNSATPGTSRAASNVSSSVARALASSDNHTAGSRDGGNRGVSQVPGTSSQAESRGSMSRNSSAAGPVSLPTPPDLSAPSLQRTAAQQHDASRANGVSERSARKNSFQYSDAGHVSEGGVSGVPASISSNVSGVPATASAQHAGAATMTPAPPETPQGSRMSSFDWTVPVPPVPPAQMPPAPLAPVPVAASAPVIAQPVPAPEKVAAAPDIVHLKESLATVFNAVQQLRDGMQESAQGLSAAVASLEARMTRSENDFKLLRGQVGGGQETLTKSLSDVVTQVNSVRSAITGSREEVGAMNKALATCQDEIQSSKRDLEQCRKAIGALSGGGQGRGETVIQMACEMSKLQEEFTDFQKHMVNVIKKSQCDARLADEVSRGNRSRLQELEVLVKGLQGTLREHTNDVVLLKDHIRPQRQQRPSESGPSSIAAVSSRGSPTAAAARGLSTGDSAGDVLPARALLSPQTWQRRVPDNAAANGEPLAAAVDSPRAESPARDGTRQRLARMLPQQQQSPAPNGPTLGLVTPQPPQRAPPTVFAHIEQQQQQQAQRSPQREGAHRSPRVRSARATMPTGESLSMVAFAGPYAKEEGACAATNDAAAVAAAIHAAAWQGLAAPPGVATPGRRRPASLEVPPGPPSGRTSCGGLLGARSMTQLQALSPQSSLGCQFAAAQPGTVVSAKVAGLVSPPSAVRHMQQIG